MITWEQFATRAYLWDASPRSAEEWSAWARERERPVSFKTKRHWRQATRAVGQFDLAQKQARLLLAAGWTPSASVHGFVRKRNTKTAAQPHVGASAVLSIDLEDFYGQVAFSRVADNLRERFDSRVCDWIEGACFRDDRLPLGLRTSPELSNLAFRESDQVLEQVAARHGVAYTRWVDDLTFSGAVSDALLSDVTETLSTGGWVMNDRKTRFMRRSPYVLGLYVGHDVDRPRLPRHMKKRLLLESYHFSQRGMAHFSHDGVMSPNRLLGRVAYAKVIEPELAVLLNRRIRQGFTAPKVERDEN